MQPLAYLTLEATLLSDAITALDSSDGNAQGTNTNRKRAESPGSEGHRTSAACMEKGS